MINSPCARWARVMELVREIGDHSLTGDGGVDRLMELEEALLDELGALRVTGVLDEVAEFLAVTYGER